jgi:hypothetical protein
MVLKHALKVKSFWLYLFVSFIGLGLFNGITTWVEPIIRPRGFTSTEAGTLGALMLVGGVFGSGDHSAFFRQDTKTQNFPVIWIFVGGSWPDRSDLRDSALAFICLCFAMGFFIVSASPIGMQYAAEITQPTPEALPTA